MDEREREYSSEGYTVVGIAKPEQPKGYNAQEERSFAAGGVGSENTGRASYTFESAQAPKKSSKKRWIAGALAACLAFGLFAAGFGLAKSNPNIINDLGNSLSISSDSAGGGDAESIALGVGNSNLEKATGSEMTIAEIAALNGNAVVEIRTEAVAYDSWFGQYVTQGAGSGVIVSTDGYIITNHHVIEGASSITVTLKDGSEYTASLVGSDSVTDIAVLKIGATNLTSAVYGDSDELVVGELSVVIGNPLGRLGGTVTAGIVSALNREVQIDGKTMTLLQTDAQISPGNSGGGMFNEKGELVGIVVAKSSTTSNAEGISFAIPINVAKEVADSIVKKGFVSGRPMLGINIVDLTSTQKAIQYGVRQLGIYVQEATSDEAKAAGFKQGDMLYYVGETRITSNEVLQAELMKHKVGDTVKVTVVRGNQLVDLNVKLSERQAAN